MLLCGERHLGGLQMIFNLEAGAINYDNTKNSLQSKNVQGALDEVSNKLNGGNLEFRIQDGKLQYRYDMEA